MEAGTVQFTPACFDNFKTIGVGKGEIHAAPPQRQASLGTAGRHKRLLLSRLMTRRNRLRRHCETEFSLFNCILRCCAAGAAPIWPRDVRVMLEYLVTGSSPFIPL